ncbi:putative lipid II flippase FtsW [Aquibacillus sp. 3ASR75-11]|uniref:Probable peptidoglycan glycosyltransferase FtsW n=1 Tax=Terrihalobacillus insolitus TaxID=2950438 RepID=A0A9X4AMQ3_9BACI|nr:putative lipid II flippase FtsW [Terrihalobacillus insolitus]MDC3412793.1 putative lipid II flippase FtsW [Terrihalobacillus insolitus]MDC3423730.1 putative lipid II flippase FtsW [Terrihalobacillus insolitus]
MKHKWKDFDFTLIITPLLLSAFGIVMIYSASMVLAVVENNPANYYMWKQLIWFMIGFVIFILACAFPYRYYQKFVKIMVIGILGLLAGVFVFGIEVNYSKSWYDFGPLSFQPAELAKIVLIIYLASIYSKKQNYIADFSKAVLPPLVMTGIILGLITLQPDIGTAAIIFLIACSVIFSSGIRFKHLFILIAIGVSFVVIAIPNMVTDERIARFSGAYEPFEDPKDDGYHLIQSYVAIGTGGILGEGLGQGVQKLGYLQEPHTDFIMAVIAEELGFVGVMIVIGMLAIIVLRGIYISRRCDDSFGALLSIGIASMIGIQTTINLGAISGLLPITGVPLPFVSYGGSSLVIMLFSMGVLNNIAYSVRSKEGSINTDTKPLKEKIQHIRAIQNLKEDNHGNIKDN